MAKELRHADVVAGALTETEYEAITEHICDGGATNDIPVVQADDTLVSKTPAEVRAILEHSIVFHVNAFQYPNPGTDWTPELVGAGLGANLAAKLCWIPLNFLKVGDIITTYNLLGDIHEEGGDTVTLDCKLVAIHIADPIVTSDVTNGGIAQQDADGNFDVTANNDDETILTDWQYTLEVEGTTSNVSGNEKIEVMGAEITITRKI